MSLPAVKWARDMRGITSTQKLVLMVLAARSEDKGDGEKAWPSIDRLAEDTALSGRAVQQAIRDLAAKNLLEVISGGGRCRTSVYRLNLETVNVVHPIAPKERVNVVPKRVKLTTERVNVVPQRVNLVHPKKEEEEREEVEKKDTALRAASAFEDWWNFYPRKVGKDGARKAYASALKRGATDADLAYGLQRQRWPSEARFIPHPATWLNGGRWQDDPEASAPPNAQPDKPRAWWLEDMINERH